MKYSELPTSGKVLLNAFISGEEIEYKICGRWVPVTESNFMLCLCHHEVRVKPKEPVVKHTYAAIKKNNGSISSPEDNIQDICYHDKCDAVSFLQRTYHDEIFVKAEVIPKLELSLKGLV